jgi:cytochrome c-type biogenesis protein CcmH
VRATLILLAVLLTALPAFAVGVDPPLSDAAQEARAQAISRGLRCLVCQNQTISESDAPLARDLRLIVRERITAGDSDDQVRAFVVARYGEWVLMRPPFSAATLLLWLGPALLLAGAGFGAWRWVRGRAPATAAPTPLSAEESERLARLLRDGDGR